MTETLHSSNLQKTAIFVRVFQGPFETTLIGKTKYLEKVVKQKKNNGLEGVFTASFEFRGFFPIICQEKERGHIQNDSQSSCILLRGGKKQKKSKFQGVRASGVW